MSSMTQKDGQEKLQGHSVHFRCLQTEQPCPYNLDSRLDVEHELGDECVCKCEILKIHKTVSIGKMTFAHLENPVSDKYMIFEQHIQFDEEKGRRRRNLIFEFSETRVFRPGMEV